MNKIFKVIWSKARNCYVVVSELAKSHDDGHVRRSRSGCCRKAAVLAAWVLTMGVNGAALAADMPKTYTKDNVKYTLSRVSGLTGVYYDSGKTKYALITYSDNNYNDKTTKTVTINDIAYDTTSTHDYSVNSSGEKSTDDGAIIDSNYTNTGAIGTGALAAGVNALAVGTNSVAIGTGATAAGNGATVIGQYASASGQYATAFGGLKTRNSNNEVIYYRNEANGDASVAFGEGTKANGEASLAFGHNTIAGARGGGQQSVAFGESTKALGGRSLAFGENTMAEFNDSVAFGNASRALSTGSLAHGNRTNAVGQYSTSWGNNTVAAGENATVFGTDAMAGAIDENGAIIITDNNNRPVKIDKNGYKAFIDTNGKTQSVTYTVTKGEIHKYLVLTDANNQKKYICDYHGDIHELYYVDDKGIVQNASGSLATSNIEKIDPGSNGYLIKNQKNATAFGNATRATAAESTAWGQESIASGEASTAFGIGSKAEGKNSLAALGGLSANENSIAIGQGTKANNDKEFVSAAIGQNAVASGKKSLALGFAGENAETSSTVASGENALALGTGAQALAKNSISIGAGNKVLGEGSGAIGDPTDITGTGSYELGNDNGTYTTDTSFNANDSGIFGNQNKVHGGTADSPLVNIRVVGNNNTVTASKALVLGNSSTVPATGGIAIGNFVKSGVGQYNNTFGSNTTAIGNESQAYHDNAVAIGTKSKATGTGSIAIGDEASTLSNQGEDNQPNDAIAIGTKAKVERGDSSIAIGKNADIRADGENTQNNIAIGTDTYIRHGSSSVVMGNAAKDNSDAGSSIVLGNGASVANSVTSNGIAIGTTAEVANTNGGVAIGNGAKATNSNGGDGSPVAVGQSAEATGTQAVAIGYKAKASGNQVGQTVVGSNANATANYGTIIGYGATGTNTQANQTAIGYLATTNAAGGVALGANSNSDRPYDSTSATSPYIPTGASDEQTKRINDTKATTGAVSVGYTDSSDSSKNVRRQIINVAAGKEDTDAVNVAQLKAVQSQSHDIAAEAVKVSAEGIIPIDGNYVGGTNADGNILANVTTNNGAKVYDLKLNKDVVLGEKEAKKGGSITVNNVDQFRKSPESTETYDVGEAVKIDGKTVSIVKVGKADAETGETNEQRQVVLGIGQDTGGYIALNDSTGKKHTYIYNAINDDNTYLDSDTSKQFNRLEYSEYLQDPEFIATLDDGMKFAGDDAHTTVAKKLNETLQIRGDGTYDKDKKTVANDGNIKTSVEDGTIKVALSDKINLHQDGSLTVGGDKQDDSTNSKDPIVIKHFDNTTLDMIGVDKDGKPITSKEGKAGDYVTGLDNKDWDVSSPTYVSGRAATEDQLKKVSDAVNSAAATAGKHTVVTVNDKDSNNETAAKAGTGAFGDYAGADKGNLLIAAKDDNGQMTYNIKLNDQLAIGKNGTDGQDGKDGKDGKVTVETSKGTTVVIGHDGEPGKDGKDGISVKGQDGKDGVTISAVNGKDGSEGHIGLTGPKGADGKNADIDISTVLGKATLDRSQNEVQGDDKDGAKDQASRIQYQTIVKEADGTPRTITHEVATMDDGMKFAGDDAHTTVAKKLNETLQIRGDGTYDKDKKTVANDGNIKTSVEDGTIKVALSDKINLHQDGSLTVGGDKQDDSTNSKDPIVIKHFDNTTLDMIGVDKDGKPITSKEGKAGDYVTGLDNKDWDVSSPTYVSGRAATEDQLKKVSDAVNSAAATAGKHTVVTVNDKDSNNETAAKAGTGAFGDYAGADKGNLLIAAKDDNGQMTYNIKLNDQLAIGQKGKPGVAGKDGKVTVETKDGTTVVIGHDGEPGKDGRDGLFVTGKDGVDGKSGVSITGPNSAAGTDGVDGKVGIAGKDGKDAVSIAGKGGVGHIGLTGPKGEKGKDGISIDITTDLKTATLDDGKNVKTVIKDKEGKETIIEQAPRIQYQSDGKNYEVATMDDGLKFVGNDGKEVTRKLNSTLSLTGGITDADALQKASGRNLGVRSNKDGNGLEIVMTDTPDFTKVTVGEGDDTTQKITIGNQTVTGKKSDGSTADQPQTGNYITGLDNKAWDKDNVVENRAATEGQLRDIAGSITNQTQGGGFALTSDEKGDDKIVKQDLGKAIQIKGDTTYKTDGSVEKAGNIKTSIDNGAIKVGLNKDVDLGNDGSVKAGNTTINQDGVDTNKVKVGDITITQNGINGGSKQITNVASGASEIIKGEDGKDVYKYDNDTNAANIGDVKQLARNEAKASEAKSGKNITVKDDHTVNLKDDITLGNDATKQVTVKGSEGQVTIGSGDKTLTLGQQANGAGDNNPATGNFLNGLDNRKWDGEHIQSGRAATEDQLKTVSDKVNSGRVFQGDDGQDVTVGLGDTLKIKGGAREVSSDPNIGIVKGADDTLNVRLAKNLTGLTSVTTGNTTINNSGLTVKTGDSSHQDITIQQGAVNMGGNKIEGVAPGKVSKDSTDAVNGSQLWQRDQAINGLSGSVNKLGNRINRVGAGAAALAALHPLDFDPDDKWDFAAGYGNYRGANAAAVGAYYRPNEDTMFSVGGSFGGGENMVNAGVSIKLGQGNHVSTSRVAMAKEMKAMRQHMAEQDALIAKLQSMHGMAVDPAKSTLFPDVAENHWAYQYVTTLAKKGILEGYPDGEFKGDRMMTRYEFAAIIYRIVESGVGSTDPELSKLVKEFSPELQYIRIDTIQKDRDGKPTIERVRVISDAK